MLASRWRRATRAPLRPRVSRGNVRFAGRVRHHPRTGNAPPARRIGSFVMSYRGSGQVS